MDFGRFLENLPGDYKTMLLSLAMIFPMAYIDCWKISCGFAELDVLKQVILAAGISVMLTMAGYFLDLACLKVAGLSKISDRLNMPVIITPTAFATATVILSPITSPLIFLFWIILVMITGFVFFGITFSGRKTREPEWSKPESGTEDQQQNTLDAAGNPQKGDSNDTSTSAR